MNTSTILLPCSYTPNYQGYFGDKRLSKRGHELAERLSQNFTTSMRSLADNYREQRAYYRFLNYEFVTEDLLIEEATTLASGYSSGEVQV